MFSIWHWAISIGLLAALAYAGKVLIRPNSPEQRMRFLQAFAVGAGLIVLSYALRIMNGEMIAAWSDVGWWVDFFVQTALAELCIGAIVALFVRRGAST